MSAQESLLAENAALRAELARAESKSARIEKENARVEKEYARIERENARLEHNLEVLTRMLFGKSSEKRSPGDPVSLDQGMLALGDLAAAQESTAREQGAKVQVALTSGGDGNPHKRRARRSKFPGHLPVVRSTYRLPENAQTCSCGGHLQEMGEEVTKELERVEISLVHEIARVKYACPACREKVVTAPGPARVIEKGLLGVGFLAHVLAERFVQHVPYHRQERKYGDEGLALSRSVLCASAGRCADLMEPIYEQMKRETLAEEVLGTDDTQVILQEGSNGGSRRAYLWLYRGLSKRCVFDFTESRSRDGPARVLKDFRGFLQADAASLYDAFYLPGGAVEVGCWAHARRKFVESESSDPTLAKEAVEQIARLYGIEKEAKDLAPEARRTLREADARPRLEDLFDWMGRTRAFVLDKSPLGEALDYALKNRVALTRYLEDGRLAIDNNGVERALRCVAIGRKNWMFVGNEEGGRRAAILYSLVQTCREIGVNPREYLRDVLLRIATCSDAAQLTPHGWKEHFEAEVHAERRQALERILLLPR